MKKFILIFMLLYSTSAFSNTLTVVVSRDESGIHIVNQASGSGNVFDDIPSAISYYSSGCLSSDDQVISLIINDIISKDADLSDGTYSYSYTPAVVVEN